MKNGRSGHDAAESIEWKPSECVGEMLGSMCMTQIWNPMLQGSMESRREENTEERNEGIGNNVRDAAGGGSEEESAERSTKWRDRVINEYEGWMSGATRAAGAMGLAFWMVEALKWQIMVLWVLPVIFGAVYSSTTISSRDMAMIVGLCVLMCVLMFAFRLMVKRFVTLFFCFHRDNWLLRHYYGTIHDPESQQQQQEEEEHLQPRPLRLFPILGFHVPHLSCFLITHLLLLAFTILVAVLLYYSRPSSSVLPFIHVFAILTIVFVAFEFAHFLCAIFGISMAMRAPDGSILILFMSLLRTSHDDRDGGWSAALGHLIVKANTVRIFDFAYKDVLIPATWATGADRPSFEQTAGACREMLRYLYAHRNGESDVVTRMKSGSSDEREVGARMVGFWVSSEMKSEVRSLRHDLQELLLNESTESKAAEESVVAVLRSKPELMPDYLLQRISMTRNEGDAHVYPPKILAEYRSMKKKQEEEEEEKKQQEEEEKIQSRSSSSMSPHHHHKYFDRFHQPALVQQQQKRRILYK